MWYLGVVRAHIWTFKKSADFCHLAEISAGMDSEEFVFVKNEQISQKLGYVPVGFA